MSLCTQDEEPGTIEFFIYALKQGTLLPKN